MQSPRYHRALVPFALALLALAAPPAFGVAQRTFVSGGGSDLNPCSLVSPCRSFGIAVAQTAADGEVIVLDSAGYGPVTLTQSVSIIAPTGVYAGISVPVGQSGVTINNAAAVVVLRGLTINGQGGNTGIVIQQATRVHVESCVVSGMGFNGLLLSSTALGTEVFVKDTIFRDNANYAAYFSAGNARATLDHVRAERSGFNGIGTDHAMELTIMHSIVSNSQGYGLVANVANLVVEISVTDSEFIGNTSSGINISSGGTGSLVRLAAARSTFRGNGGRGIYATASATGVAQVSVQDSTFAGNNTGIFGDGPGVNVTASNNMANGNNFGFAQANSAVFESFGNNVRNNVTDTSGTITPLTPI